MKRTKTRRRQRKTIGGTLPPRPSMAEISQRSTEERHKAFDVLNTLETSLIEISGVTEIMLELACAAVVAGKGPAAIFGYLGQNLHRHQKNARGAFNHLHDYLHGPLGAPAGVGERVMRDREREQST